MPDGTVRLLFWNVQNSRPLENIVRLAEEYHIDILLLAESGFEIGESDLLNALNATSEGANFSVIASAQEAYRVPVYSRLHDVVWTLKINRSRYAIWEIRGANEKKFLLATAHFPPIQYQQGDEQRESAIALRLDLEAAEGDWDAPVSLVIGDLNATPYDAGILGVYGLNATPSRRIASGPPREYNGRKYKHLYNPMWRFLADVTPGTYYNSGISAPIRSDWYLLDQVLLRPAMLQMFDEDAEQAEESDERDLRILKYDGVSSLVEENGAPVESLSDHLPLFFRFRL